MEKKKMTPDERVELQRLAETHARVEVHSWKVLELLIENADMRQSLDDALGPHCSSCGNSIYPEVCWCGSGPADKHFEEHGFIPMGCECSRGERDWKKLAVARGELLWKALRDLERWEALGAKHDLKLREVGCKCHREEGDSPCPVHPSEDA